MADPLLPPVQGMGKRDGNTPADIPDGYISWAEHYEAWEGYHKKFRGHTAETIANMGGFTYAELVENLGHHPKTWVVRDLVRFGGFNQPSDDGSEDPVDDNSESTRLRSHIWFAGAEKPICMMADSPPDQPFNFDSEEAYHCSPCLRKLHSWVAMWINYGRKAEQA